VVGSGVTDLVKTTAVCYKDNDWWWHYRHIDNFVRFVAKSYSVLLQMKQASLSNIKHGSSIGL